MDAHRRPRQHFLIVAFPTQSHINPALRLAHRLASGGALVTFSTSASTLSRLSASIASDFPGGNLTCAPYPDNYATRGFQPDAQTTAPGSYSNAEFSAVILDLAARGRRVTCVIYTLLLTWAADVALELGIPSAQFWIQPATTFAAYYHYFHGYESLIKDQSNNPRATVKLPGLPPLQIRELPSFLTTDSEGIYSMVLPRFKESFASLDQAGPGRRPKILVNTCDELEPEAIRALDDELDLIPIGPILPTASGFDLLEPDEKRYMEWLDSKADKSVVFVSFGSISVVKKQQMEEILKGLKASRRPYLWVVRKDSRCEGVELDGDEDDEGMVVDWCAQVRVLGHRAVGCFVTHCGWNSTAESLLCGVPMVGVPQWTDQGTNAMLMEKAWGVGVRGEVNEEGVLQGEELRRCLDLVMGEEERGREMRRNAAAWREKARGAVSDGGSSDRNLRAFVEEIAQYDGNCE